MKDKAIDDRGASEAIVEEQDDFEKAYATAEGVGERADLSAADDPANIPDETKPPEVKPVAVVETPKPEEQQPGETDEKYEQRYKTLQGIHKHDKEAWETEKSQLLSQLEEAKKPKAPEKAEPTEEQKKAAETFIDSLTDQQKKELEEYEQDFDVVSKMEGIKRNVELAKLRKEMKEWQDAITAKQEAVETRLSEQGNRLMPIVAKAEENDTDTHFNAIRDGHPDFEKYRDDGSITKWIESKPKYLQPALKEAYSKGTADDVIDLISDFKKDNNIQAQAPSDNVVQIDQKKAAKKQALTSVTSRRGAVNTSVAVSEDFEGAFDEALNK